MPEQMLSGCISLNACWSFAVLANRKGPAGRQQQDLCFYRFALRTHSFGLGPSTKLKQNLQALP